MDPKKAVFWRKKNKEENRYYLLPGMARSNRRRHRQVVWWSIVFGVIFSALFGAFLYFINRPGV